MITKKDIGRKVVVNGSTFEDQPELENKRGIIISYEIDEDELNVGIEFDDPKDFFHDCFGKCKPYHGYFVKENMVTFIDDKENGEFLHKAMECALSLDPDPYNSLGEVLDDAYEQSSMGKGVERHANDNNFEDQVICVVGRLLKDHPFGAHAYQVIKKTIEAGRLYKIKGSEAAYQEMLGAIVYAAAMNILIKEAIDE